MSTLRFYPGIKYHHNNLLFELKRPMEEILLHLVDDIGCDLDGYNLLSINDTGVHLKNNITSGFGLDLISYNTLQIVGVDIL